MLLGVSVFPTGHNENEKFKGVPHFQRREKFKILHSAYVHLDALYACQRLQTNMTTLENI